MYELVRKHVILYLNPPGTDKGEVLAVECRNKVRTRDLDPHNNPNSHPQVDHVITVNNLCGATSTMFGQFNITMSSLSVFTVL